MNDPTGTAKLAAAQNGDKQAFDELIEPYRRELLGYCYRLLGSLQDAEDLVQEVLLRAWLKPGTFERRGSLRAWLYKIATNTCLNALTRSPMRSLPVATHAPADVNVPPAPPISEPIWLEPFPDDLLADASTAPEAVYTVRESVTLAFLVALHILPPHQRAVLILRDVLDWRANEVAELLDLTLPAVNSALQRARATLAKHYHPGGWEAAKPPQVDEDHQKLLNRYVHAWENANVADLVALLKEDATFSMPPLPGWYPGREAIGIFFASTIFKDATPGYWHLLPTRANAHPAFGLYQRDEASGEYRPFGIAVLSFDGEEIAATTVFMESSLCARFALPPILSL
jgi:RNA polymerase sigma-70 factor (ECF subfamily)